jgi:hypothetical protein
MTTHHTTKGEAQPAIAHVTESDARTMSVTLSEIREAAWLLRDVAEMQCRLESADHPKPANLDKWATALALVLKSAR